MIDLAKMFYLVDSLLAFSYKYFINSFEFKKKKERIKNDT